VGGKKKKRDGDFVILSGSRAIGTEVGSRSLSQPRWRVMLRGKRKGGGGKKEKGEGEKSVLQSPLPDYLAEWALPFRLCTVGRACEKKGKEKKGGKE